MHDSVDELLCGGLREGHLTELFGESASGKTQVIITGTLWIIRALALT